MDKSLAAASLRLLPLQYLCWPLGHAGGQFDVTYPALLICQYVMYHQRTLQASRNDAGFKTFKTMKKEFCRCFFFLENPLNFILQPEGLRNIERCLFTVKTALDIFYKELNPCSLLLCSDPLSFCSS